MKSKVIRIGRYWIDRALYREGYRPKDIFEQSRLELPELLDPDLRRNLGWLVCPECGEQSQVDRFDPCCGSCGWSREQDVELTPCAA